MDQASKAYAPFVIPCRKAIVVETSDHGTTAVIELSVQELAYAADIDAFQRSIAAASRSDLPTWANGKLQGHWLLPLLRQEWELAPHNDQVKWHAIVDQLCARSDFAAGRPFVNLLGLKRLGAQDYLRIRDPMCWYELEDDEYQFDVYHYHRNDPPPDTSMSFTFSNHSGQIREISSISSPLDSRYDKKKFRFRISSGLSVESTVLIIRIGERGSGKAEIEYDITLKISPSTKSLFIRIVSIGFFVAMPGLIALGAANKLGLVTGALAVFSGLFAGAASTLRWPRSV